MNTNKSKAQKYADMVMKFSVMRHDVEDMYAWLIQDSDLERSEMEFAHVMESLEEYMLLIECELRTKAVRYLHETGKQSPLI